MVSILLTPWGNPSVWKKVRYVYEDEEIESHTTLPIILRKHHPDYILIVGLDTISLYNIDKDKLSEGRIDYLEDVINASRIYITEKLEEWDIDRENVHIEILPGVGEFHQKKKFIWLYHGKITDFKYTLTYFLSKFLITHLKNGNSDAVNLIIDLTHGINYMPTFVYNSSLTLGRLLRFKYKEVSLTVLNSEPVQHPYKGKYRINKVAEIDNLAREYIFEMLSSYGGGIKPLKIANLKNRRSLAEEIKSFNKKYELRASELNTFLGGIINGLPLVILTYFPDISQLRDMLLEILSLYVKYTDVKTEKKKLDIIHNFNLTKNFEVLSIIHFLGYLLKDIKTSLSRETSTLEQLYTVKEMIYKGNDRNMYLISNELYILEESCREYIASLDNKDNLKFMVIGPKHYAEIMKDNAEEYKLRSKSSFYRNFLSHAGLEKNITTLYFNMKRYEKTEGDIRKAVEAKYDLDEKMKIESKKEYKVRELIEEAAKIGLIRAKI